MHRKIAQIALSLLLLCISGLSWAADKTEVTWYGHAAFKIVTPQGHVLFVDPWLANPVNPEGAQDLKNITKADLILVSHGHFDHVGNATEIARQTTARLVTTFDLGNALAAYGGFPKDRMGYDSLGNFGGTVSFFENDVQVTFIPAVHSSSVNPNDLKAGTQQDRPEFAGNPGGFLIRIKNGPTIYHTGDTDLFGDMALIPKHHPVDVMLTCIGDHFTMGPNRAAEAVAMVQPKQVVPMHYGTFPTVLTGTLETFRSALKQKHLEPKLVPMSIKKPVEF